MTAEETKILTVRQLAQGLKKTVEQATAGLWVEGEVGRVQRPASGHVYFSLKDDEVEATIDCVMYKRDALRFGKHLVEGSRLTLRGRASFYAPRGRLQWIADVARPAGAGALLEALERLKQKLIAEGLTDPARKRPLPDEPRLIGIVTSRTGAALGDIMTVASRRGRVRLVVAHALVQGEQAPNSIIEALDRIERLAPDAVIVGRGGGSVEDLAAFSDERVVRRIAAMNVVTVSAVGHEMDWALADLVADARAATPSQAAEMLVPDHAARRDRLDRATAHLARVVKDRVMRQRLVLNQLRGRISDPRFVLFEHQQRVDDLRSRLSSSVGRKLHTDRNQAARLERRLAARHPRVVLERSRTRLGPLQQRLSSGMTALLVAQRAQLAKAGASLHALSPLAVLGRGYALATTEEGAPIVDARRLRPGQMVSVSLQHGRFDASVSKVHDARALEIASPLRAYQKDELD